MKTTEVRSSLRIIFPRKNVFGSATDGQMLRLTGPHNTHAELQRRVVLRVKFAGRVSRKLTKPAKAVEAPESTGVRYATAQDRLPGGMDRSPQGPDGPRKGVYARPRPVE